MNYSMIDMDAVLSEYYKRQSDNIRSLEDRKEEIYDKIPEIEKLSHEISDYALTLAKKRIMREEGIPSPEEAELHIRELSAKKTELLKKNGYPADYLEMHYTCPICKDEGYVDNKPCKCLTNHIIKEFYKSSNLLSMIGEENFDNFRIDYYSDKTLSPGKRSPRENVTDILSRSHKFIDDFGKTKNSGNIYIFGDVGLGKTFLCNCIAKELLDKGVTVFYVTAIEMFDIISQKIRSRDIADDIMKLYDFIYSSELLIIDDLGTETNNSFIQSNLFDIINRRLLLGRSTIISSNMDINDLKEHYTERTASRIIENYDFFRMYGDNIRYTKKLQEIK